MSDAQHPSASDARRTRRLEEAFDREEAAALGLVTRARLGVCAALALYMMLWDQSAVQLFWAGQSVAFGLLGLVYSRLGRSRHRAAWHSYLFVAVDAAFIAAVLLWRNPYIDQPWPLPMNFRYPGVVLFFVVLALTALTYAPKVVLWAGLASAAAWGVGVVVVLTRPGAYSELSLSEVSSLPNVAHMKHYLDPQFVALDGRFIEMFAMLLAAAILATAARRSRRLVDRQMRAERARANLGRYFSPTLVDELAGADAPFGPVRSATVAVLFADIVGFSRLSEAAGPEATIRLLRDFHGRMARAVFERGGTVDKYIGDCVMATFGTPTAGPRDATDALGCARAMIQAVEDMNSERRARGEPRLGIGIGLHYGPAMLGDIGDERRVEFAVIGDTVNVASRLEALTRETGSPLLVSREAVEAARREGAGPSELAGLVEAGETAVRGRAGRVGLWTLAPAPGPAGEPAPS